uniref:CCHC-type domain-containing protein n=1 Tax=Parascaris univalens TaxID=6257 RepID=A0A915ABQ0_PARUN
MVTLRNLQRGSFESSNELSEGQSTMPRVIFCKLSAIPLTTDNYKTIISVLTMRGQPAETLLASIQQGVISLPDEISLLEKTEGVTTHR